MTLYHNAVVITMDSRHSIYQNGALVVEDARIKDVGPAKEMLARYPGAQRVDCAGGVLMPGLINTHVHLSQCLMRGFADDLDILPWLRQRIWPVLAGYTPESFLISAKLNMAEMLLSGTTTFVDPMFAGHYGMDGMVKAVEASGMRGCIGKIVMDGSMPGIALPPVLRESKTASFGQAVDAYQRYHGAANGRVQIWLAPRWTALFNRDLLPQVARYMDRFGMRTTIHYAESDIDVDTIKDATGLSPAEFLRTTGLARPETLLVHCTRMPQKDDALLGQSGLSIAYCPTSTAKTAMGTCRASDFASAGINVAMGTDAAACNNNSDLFLEMRFGALVQKQAKSDATVFSADEMLGLATINGAKALGLDNEIGSLEAGKQADFILVDTNKPRLLPMPNPGSGMVYAATGQDVSAVVVQGKTLVQNGKLLTMDVDRIMREAKELMASTMDRLKFPRD